MGDCDSKVHIFRVFTVEGLVIINDLCGFSGQCLRLNTLLQRIAFIIFFLFLLTSEGHSVALLYLLFDWFAGIFRTQYPEADLFDL